jgi:hypothetical protein
MNMALRSAPEVPEMVSGVTTSSIAPVSSVTGMPAAVSTSATSSASSGLPDPADYRTFDDFQAAVGGTPYSTEFLMERWAEVHGWASSAP